MGILNTHKSSLSPRCAKNSDFFTVLGAINVSARTTSSCTLIKIKSNKKGLSTPTAFFDYDDFLSWHPVRTSQLVIVFFLTLGLDMNRLPSLGVQT